MIGRVANAMRVHLKAMFINFLRCGFQLFKIVQHKSVMAGLDGVGVKQAGSP